MKVQEAVYFPPDVDLGLKRVLSSWTRDAALQINHQDIAIIIAVGDETTAITTGTAKVTFRMPYAIDLNEVRCSLSTAQTSGSIFTVDVNNAGTSVITTKLTIDNTEKTSTTAATQPILVYGSTRILADAEVTIDVDQVGDGTAKGLKVSLIGRLV